MYRWFLCGILSAATTYAPSIAAEEVACPKVNCDCSALEAPKWRESCLAAEQQAKAACVANGGEPARYCSLHGPEATPVALSTEFPTIDDDSLKSAKLYKRQAVMLLWSVNDDLVNTRNREEKGAFGEALQVHKLLEANVDRLFAQQYRAAESERSRNDTTSAIGIWQDYRKDITDTLVEFEAYSDVLWDRFKRAEEGSRDQKAYRLLAMRMLRTTSNVAEHLALARTGEGQAKEAAAAWQQAANIAQKLIERELESSANAQHLAYYQNQAAARWNRASYYWVSAKEELRAEQALASASALLP